MQTKGRIAASLLTGGFDKPYTLGLTMALLSKDMTLDVVGGDDVDSPELHGHAHLRFLNLRGSKQAASLISKVARVLIYYVRVLRYAATAEPKIFHILWNNKFDFFDRTLLMLYYKMLGKKIVFTAHNVNSGKRDGNDSLLNRIGLRLQYRLADHIFVHTEKMKEELLQDFAVGKESVSVIPFGINNSVPDTVLTPRAAKRQLGLRDGEKTILFFGAILPYKGLEFLVDAFRQLAPEHPEYRLIIAGQPRKTAGKYVEAIQDTINRQVRDRVIQKLHYIPDAETELYFKAADVAVLPYKHVFQSGILFLAYNFGVPVIATDVGSMREEVVEGQTGFLCRPCDSLDLARAMETYFQSDLFKNLERRRRDIREYANTKHSWDVVSEITRKLYSALLSR
jgi:glycosyltransferase involved in cell wall biosynthesis